MGEEHKLNVLSLNLLERDRLLYFIRNKEGGDPLAMKIHRVIEASDSAIALDVRSMGILHGILEKHEAWKIWGLGTEESKKALEKIIMDGVDSSSGHREGLRGDCWPPLLTFNDLEELAEKMGGHVVYYAGVADICRVGHTPVKSFKAVVTRLVYAEKDTVLDTPPKTIS